ncbi:MAG TPA: hypothetical protein VK041_10040, partial [Opitutales bacterium]|nr:hypothetical protein [Opitutales bacterium]
CRLPGKKGRRFYGREVPVGNRDPENLERVQIVRPLRKKLRENEIPVRRFVTEKEFREKIVPLVPSVYGGGRLFDVVERNGAFSVRIDFSDEPKTAWRDSHGAFLVDPPERKEYPLPCQSCDQLTVCEKEITRKMSPAFAWRRLGLIGKDGRPTRRGIIFSFFFHGEGLAVAAALEDESYPISELVYDVANLRAGHRFSEEDLARGSRLGSVCRDTYPTQNFPGYLEHGLPPTYGDGAAEVLREVYFNPAVKHRLSSDFLRAGDIERAFLEWRSLLRQIAFAPDFPWGRWMDLKEEAREMLEETEPVTLKYDFPPLPPSQRKRCNHILRF